METEAALLSSGDYRETMEAKDRCRERGEASEGHSRPLDLQERNYALTDCISVGTGNLR